MIGHSPFMPFLLRHYDAFPQRHEHSRPSASGRWRAAARHA